MRDHRDPSKISVDSTTIALAAALLSFGCSGAPATTEYVYETEHFRLTAHSPICGGTIGIVEGEATRIAAAQRLPLGRGMELHIGPDTNEDCNYAGPIGGCASGVGLDARVSSRLFSVPHELAHQIRRSAGITGPTLFEEGLATLLSGGALTASHVSMDPATVNVGPMELVETQSHSFFDTHDGTRVGAHFLAWMRARYGADETLAWLNGPDYRASLGADADKGVFEAHFGESLSAAESAWRDSASYSYDFGGPCEMKVTDLAASPLSVAAKIDCQDRGTIGPFGDEGYASVPPWCVSAPPTGDVRVTVQGPVGVELVLDDFHGCSSSANVGDAPFIVHAGTSEAFTFHGCRWTSRARADAMADPAEFTVVAELLEQ